MSNANVTEALLRARDTKMLELGPGAISKVPQMFKSLFPGSRAVVVTDAITFKVAGKDVDTVLRNADVEAEQPFVFESPDLYAEWEYVLEIERFLSTTDAIAVAVGSGVINDLTKLVSHRLGRRYMIVGTAASMDGYAAFGASITYEGIKQTFDCPAPLGIVFDSAIAAGAPEGMSASGYADLLAKVPAGVEWVLSGIVGADDVDPFAYGLVQNGLRKALSEPSAVAAGDIEATSLLAEGLIMSGFAMQAVSSSRPASGIEHQFSHFWDMEGLCHEGKHVSHGFKVGIGTLVSCACLEYLAGYDMEAVDVEKCKANWPSWEQMEAHIRTIYDGMPAHLEKALKETKAKYSDKDTVGKQIQAVKDVWPEFKERIKSQSMTYAEAKECLKLVRAPYEPEHISLTREHLRKTFVCIPFMRSRYTAIDLIQRLGIMDEVEAWLFGPGGYFA